MRRNVHLVGHSHVWVALSYSMIYTYSLCSVIYYLCIVICSCKDRCCVLWLATPYEAGNVAVSFEFCQRI